VRKLVANHPPARRSLWYRAMDRSRVFAGTLALLTGLALTACAETPPRPPPNVLIVVLDTLRADRLGAYGSQRRITPFLDELASRGTVFANAYSTSSWTMPAVASLFTSRYQSQHRIEGLNGQLAEREVTLAEKLDASGYLSAGFSANILVDIGLGYGQGFTPWRTFNVAGEGPRRRPSVRAGIVCKAALRWLDARLGRPEEPIFLYLQYMDPHIPYDPPESIRRRFLPLRATPEMAVEANRKLRTYRFAAISDREFEILESLYDGEVAHLDGELRQLFGDLEQRDFLENAIVIVTSDHGEEFREHDRLQHGHALYEESVRVPLIVLAPGIGDGRVVEQPVSLLDLAPTILDLARLPSEPHFEGRSLRPLLEADGDPERAAVVLELAAKGDASDSRVHGLGLIRGSAKLLVDTSGRASIYDLAADPGEKRPLDPRSSETGVELLATLERVRSAMAQRASEPTAGPGRSEEEMERLRELGYLAE